jgi:hemoglobin
MAEEGPERRARLSQEIRDRTGIDEAMIETLVRTFYARVRADALIGPIFEAKVRDWDHHLGKLCDFWSSVVLMTGRYHGQPMQAHTPLPVGREHFDRWLALFEETAKAICPPQAAAIFVERAQRIADSFELGLAARRGEIATPRFSQRGGTVRVVPPAMRDRA